MSNFIQVTPFMHVHDLDRALAFFTDILGFETRFRATGYAYVHRETAGFRILEQRGAEGAPPGNRRFAYYIDVRDVDRLYAELKPRLDTLPQSGRVRAGRPELRPARAARVGARWKLAGIRAGDPPGLT